MSTFTSFGLQEAYAEVGQLGDRLSEMGKLMDWKGFRPPFGEMYNNKRPRREDGPISMLFLYSKYCYFSNGII